MSFMSIKTTSPRPPKKPAPQDWHPADIIAAIWKRRTNLVQLSRLNGYADTSLQQALRNPWPRAEKIIAEAIGVPPQQIWPSRYKADGSSNRPMGNPNWLKHSTARKTRAA